MRKSDTPQTDALNAQYRPYFTNFESDAIIYFDAIMDDFEKLERQLNSARVERGPTTAEEILQREGGVFKGAHGLRGLANADEFWETKPYGTRLYYGPSGLDYLHRSILRSAVDLLDKIGITDRRAPVVQDPTNVQRLLNEAAIHFESFPGGRDGNGRALLYRAIEELKDAPPKERGHEEKK